MIPRGQKRRLLQLTAAPQLPLYAVSGQTPAALRYVATPVGGLAIYFGPLHSGE